MRQPSGDASAATAHHVQDEVFDNFKENRRDLDAEKLDRTRWLMGRSVRDCLIVGYEPIIGVLKLPDSDDRHVLAAAIKARAQLIVTSNLNDFPSDALAQWNVEAKHPDEFILDPIDLNRQVVYGAVQRIADSWRHPAGTVDDVLNSLHRNGLVEPVALLWG